MPLPDMLMIDGVEYRRVDRDAPAAEDPTAGHGPLPWTTFHRHIGSADGMYVCESPAHETIGRHAWDANRAFIIRATAHHAELLAFVDSIGSNAGSRYDACSSSVRREARELLSKVKGT